MKGEWEGGYGREGGGERIYSGVRARSLPKRRQDEKACLHGHVAQCHVNRPRPSPNLISPPVSKTLLVWVKRAEPLASHASQ